MLLTKGDRVRHRGLRFLSGIVVRVMRISDVDGEDERAFFFKVELTNGQYYSDRAIEWELDAPVSSTKGSDSKMSTP